MKLSRRSNIKMLLKIMIEFGRILKPIIACSVNLHLVIEVLYHRSY